MLDNLPAEILQHILSYSSDKDVANVRKMSRGTLFLSGDTLVKREANKLLTHVVKGEEEQALAMIEANPHLLLKTAEAKDYSGDITIKRSGRIIKQTAFEAALCAGDDIMARKMLPFFEPGEVLRQFDKAFPEGVAVTDNLQQQAFDFQPLINVIADGNQEAIDKAMSQFCQSIAPQEIITKGSHFNMYHLINAYHAYVNNFNSLQNWNNRDFFWQKVIGYVQRQMPAHYAQAYCSELYRVIEKGHNLQRSLPLYDGSVFYSDSLGADLAYASSRSCSSTADASLAGVGPLASLTTKFLQQKTNEVKAIRDGLAPKPHCQSDVSQLI